MKQGGGAWGGGLLRAGGPLGDLTAGVPADPVSPLRRSWGVPDHPCLLQSLLGWNRGPLAAPFARWVSPHPHHHGPGGPFCPHVHHGGAEGAPSVPAVPVPSQLPPQLSCIPWVSLCPLCRPLTPQSHSPCDASCLSPCLSVPGAAVFLYVVPSLSPHPGGPAAQLGSHGCPHVPYDVP